jgi:hypothetical protein
MPKSKECSAKVPGVQPNFLSGVLWLKGCSRKGKNVTKGSKSKGSRPSASVVEM